MYYLTFCTVLSKLFQKVALFMAVIDTEKKLPISGHNPKLNELIKKLDANLESGLTNEEAKRRLKIYGLNVIPKPKQSFWQVYLAPLLNTLIVIYLIMTAIIVILALIYLFINPSNFSIWITAIQWLIIVGVNFLIAIIQQARAQKKIEALHKLAAPEARVFREGKEIEIETENVVPGDIIRIAQGDKIPADARILNSSALQINEASLTGESVPTEKFDDGTIGLSEDTPISERKNMLYNGTFATMGSGKALVVNTGGNTEFGKISLELEELNTGDIPIRSKVNAIGNYLIGGMLVVFTILVVYRGINILNLIANQDPRLKTPIDLIGFVIFELSTIIITAMSTVPINIPLLSTIVLITGVLAMAKRNVIIRNLASIESLGRISVLCSDKTGTITAGQMTVKSIWNAFSNKYYYVSGLGLSPKGKIVEIGEEDRKLSEEEAEELKILEINPNSSLGILLISGMLNNDSQITEEIITATGQKIYNGTGSPTDSALLAVFDKTKIGKNLVKELYELQREYPFDSSLKRMSKIFSYNKKEIVVFTKGATEVILPRCTHLGYPEKAKRQLSEKERNNILKRTEDFAAQGYRIISFAYKNLPSLPKKGEKEREDVESNLSYLGFMALLDPPRERVSSSVSETLAAGIIPIMITGDSPITAASIAENIGMIHRTAHQTHEGKMASKLNDEDFTNTRVFARVAPQDKQTIVERYQKQKRIVAMTGDGVNDALALSMADAGIAMGIAGTEVSKQAADLVIADDSFNSIVTGIREGRALFQRIRVIIFFYICVNLAEAAAYIGASFFTNLIPGVSFALLDNLQRAYIFGIAHSFPPIALIVDKIPKDIMERTPIDSAGIFNKKLALSLGITSLSLASMVYITYFTTLFGFIPVNEINQAFFIPEFQNPADILTGLRPIDMTGIGIATQLSHAKARTFMHTIIYIAIPLIVLSIRRIDKSIVKAIKEDSWWFTYACVFSIILLHLALMYFKDLQQILNAMGIQLDIIALSLGDWMICIIAAVIPVVTLEIAKWYNRSRGEYY